MKPSPAVALAEPLVRGGATVTVLGAAEGTDGQQIDHVAVVLADGTRLHLDVEFDGEGI